VDDPADSEHAERVRGDVPEGVGPEVFRERLDQARRHGAEHGGHITLDDQSVYLDDIDSVEAEEEEEGEGHHSRVRLRNGLIIGGLTGAAIVAALATVRYRRRRHQ
jgi:hypothetical protein